MPKKVDRHAKRKDIGAAAIRVFRQLGYHHTRMADIADTAELLLSIFDGIVLHRVLDQPRCDAKGVQQTAIEIVSRGLFVDPLGGGTRATLNRISKLPG